MPSSLHRAARSRPVRLGPALGLAWLVMIGGLWLATVGVRAQTLVEPFNYPDGEITKVSGGLWTVQTAGTAFNISNGTAVINQGDLTVGLEKVSRAIDTPFTTSGNSVAYYAFDATWTALPLTDTGSYFLNLSVATNGTTYYGRVGADTDGAAAGRFRLAVANANWSQANSVEFPLDLQLNVSYPVVVRYDLTTGNTTLWLNPTSEASDSVTATDPPAGAQQAIAAINLRPGLSNSSTGAPGVIRMDDLFVGTTFEQVAVHAPPAIVQQPTNVTVMEGETAVFAVQLANPALVTAQWQLAGQAIPNATNTVLNYGPVTLADDQSVFSAVLSNRLGSTNAAPAVLTVVPDVTPPTLISAVNLDAVTIQLTFSEALAEPGATLVGNYVLNAGLTVSAAAFGSDPRTILLTTSPLQLGVSYTVSVNGVTDRSHAANPLAPDTAATFVATELVPASIGAPTPADAVLPLTDGGYALSSAGLGAEGAADQLQFAWQAVTGDFDRRVRVESVLPSDVWAQAGLMLRETLDAGSRFAAMTATPSLNGVFFESRLSAGAAAAKSGSFPVNHPQTWLRLQRVGNTVTGYAGFDGSQWTPVGSVTLVLPGTVYVGLSAASHAASGATTARFHQLGSAAGGTVAAASPLPFEPPGPTSRKTGLAITEIMYHAAPRPDGRNLAFIELFNSNPWPEDISGYQLAGDISYAFPAGTLIAGGGFLVVAKSPADLEQTYGLSGVLGPYANPLPVSGVIQLLDHGNIPAVYLEVPYQNLPPWTAAADGTGHSLVLKRPSYGEGFVEAWGLSESLGGSPGMVDAYRSGPWRQVVINELFVNPGTGQAGYVELYNHGNQPVDISGCQLTDFPGTNRFVIPTGTSLPAQGFVSFTVSQLGFAPEPTGETLYFETPDAQTILDVAPFEAQEQGVATGRVPDGGSEFHRLQNPTPGNPNGPARVADVVINELMVKPLSGLKDDQYVELFNQGSAAVDLSGWQFAHGIKFTFPAGTLLQPNGYLVVAKNAARLLTNYPNLSASNTLGDFGGSLSGSGERVALAQPQPFVTVGKKGSATTNQVAVILDEVSYGLGGRWGHWSDGGGSSLELRDPHADHRLAANWGDSDDTGKAPWTTVEATSVLDLGATQGATPIDRLDVLMSGEAECLLDNVEVIQTDSGTNRLSVADSTFESGIGGWFATGDHIQSHLETSGGFGGGQCLHIHSTDRGDTMVNHLRVPLQRALTIGKTVTLRAKVRWLRGFPEIILRVKGNYAEAPGELLLPTNLGTPGAPNSQRTDNVGPAISEVTHFPVLPADQQPVVVSARINDPDGFSQIKLSYRLDPATTLVDVPMTDDGTGGDAVAGDGIYSGTIPGQPAGTLVAFQIVASDNAATPVTARFPADAPARECLVRFGEPGLSSSFGTYHFWLTQARVDLWTSLASISNERHDGTFVYGNSRVIYNVQGKFAGSPYHQGFGSPVDNNCHYSFEMPGDDQFLGATSFNKIHAPGNAPWEDDTLQREQTAYGMVRSLGLPWNYRRYVNFFFNGNRRQPSALMEDTQTPDADVVGEHFPNDSNGNLYKLQPWFEFADNGQNFDNQGWCTLNNYLSGGKKKLARYRVNYLTRHAHATASDYTNVFQLIDTAALPVITPGQKAAYVQAMNGSVDTDEWLRTMAVQHAVGNWDSFLNNNGQNMYAYKPESGRWTLFIWDYNIVLGLGNYSDGPSGDDLFKTTIGDNGAMNQFAGAPIYRRALWRAFEELVNGAMNSTNANPLIDARYAAFKTEGVAASPPTALKSWINTRHSYLLTQLKTVATTFSVTTSAGADVVTAQNPLVLTGQAPVGVQDIEVNGITYPVVWTDVRHWQLNLPLAGVTNALVIRGLDRFGNPVAGDESRFNVIYTGALEPLGNQVVLNEIMYHPAIPNAEFIELYNRSATTPFDLSGWRLDGAGYTFPEGTTIGAGAYLVLAKNRSAFTTAYGRGIPVADVFAGFLRGAGGLLQLIKPGITAADDQLVNAVLFRGTAPWPVAADGQGPSLQLIDPTQDNSRVANWAASAPGASPSYTPGQPNTFLASLPAFPALWINEMLPENTTTNTDNFGEHDPFIELYNGGTNTLDLSTCFLADNYTNLTQWNFPAGTTVAPGGFLVVWADGQPAQSAPGVLHTSFRLTPGSGTVSMTCLLGAPAQPVVLDYLDYSLIRPGHSFGSLPEGQGTQRSGFYYVTPGTSNNPALGPNPVFINEWMAANSHTITNAATGLADDWFELYNAGPNAVNLTGFQLSIPVANPTRFVIPSGTVVPPYGFLLVWADKLPTANAPGTPLHLPFHLSKNGTDIGLFATDGSLVDSVSFGAQNADISEGRAPDGTDNTYVNFYLPTPGTANVPLTLRPSFDPDLRQLHLAWPTQPGLHYRVVFRDSLTMPWQSLTDFTATDVLSEVVDDTLGNAQRFYGLVLER